ncbi:MAG: hypothetical protein LBL48_07530 [Azoarcus sp.]|jgi:hypothetical protein|nr:hypothetical protein [Azoarcus sp.]
MMMLYRKSERILRQAAAFAYLPTTCIEKIFRHGGKYAFVARMRRSQVLPASDSA